MSTWHAGRSLHKALDKLLATWANIFPQLVLDDIGAQLAAARAADAPAQVQPPAGFGFLQPQLGYGGMPAAMLQQPAAAAAALYPQPGTAVAGYQQPTAFQLLGGFPAAPGLQPMPYQQPPLEQQLQQPHAAAPPQAQQINVADLLSSLMNAGLLTAPVVAPAASAPAAGAGGDVAAPGLRHGNGGDGGRQLSASPAPSEQHEQPATTKFIPERLKVQSDTSAGVRALGGAPAPCSAPCLCATYFPPASHAHATISPSLCASCTSTVHASVEECLPSAQLPPSQAATWSLGCRHEQHQCQAPVRRGAQLSNKKGHCDCADQQAGRHTTGSLAGDTSSPPMPVICPLCRHECSRMEHHALSGLVGHWPVSRSLAGAETQPNQAHVPVLHTPEQLRALGAARGTRGRAGFACLA